MSSVSTGVEALLQALHSLHRDGALVLVRPAQPTQTVRKALKQAGVPTSVDVLDWFSVWDGQRAEGVLGVMDVLPGFYALSLVDALAHRSQQAWPATWLPLLADGGGDYLVVDAAGAGTPVFRHRFDEPEPEMLTTSLGSFVNAAVAAFTSGVVYVQDDYLEQDEEAWGQLLANRR